MKYTTKKISMKKENGAILQLLIQLENNKLILLYTEELLQALEIEVSDFNQMMKNIQQDIINKNFKENIDIVSLYLVESEIKNKSGEYEVTQELKVVANNKKFTQAECKQLNKLILAGIFLKLGIEKKESERAFEDEK